MNKQRRVCSLMVSALLVACALPFGPPDIVDDWSVGEPMATAVLEDEFAFPETMHPQPYALETTKAPSVLEFDPVKFDQEVQRDEALARVMEILPSYKSVGWRMWQGYEGGSESHIFPVTDGERMRYILHMRTPEENGRWESVAYLVTLREEGLLLYDRDGGILYGESDIQVLNADGSVRWSVSGDIGYGSSSSVRLASFDPRLSMPDVGPSPNRQVDPRALGECTESNWDEFVRCMGGLGGATVLGTICAGSLYTVKDACAAAFNSGGALSHGCIGAILVAVGSCGLITNVCIYRCVDNLPEIALGAWREAAYKSEILWEGGTITSQVMCARIHYRDDRMPCCETTPESGHACAPRGSGVNTAYVTDCGGNVNSIDYKPPDPTTSDLATFRRPGESVSSSTRAGTVTYAGKFVGWFDIEKRNPNFVRVTIDWDNKKLVEVYGELGPDSNYDDHCKMVFKDAVARLNTRATGFKGRAQRVCADGSDSRSYPFEFVESGEGRWGGRLYYDFTITDTTRR